MRFTPEVLHVMDLLYPPLKRTAVGSHTAVASDPSTQTTSSQKNSAPVFRTSVLILQSTRVWISPIQQPFLQLPPIRRVCHPFLSASSGPINMAERCFTLKTSLSNKSA